MLEYNSIGGHAFDGSKPKRMRTFPTENTEYISSLPFNSVISIDVEKIFLHSDTIIDSPITHPLTSDEPDLVSKRNPLFELPTLPKENFDNGVALSTNGTEGVNSKTKILASQSNISKENEGQTQNTGESNGRVLEKNALKRCHSYSGKFGNPSTKDLTISINPVKISNEKCLNFRYTMERRNLLQKHIETETELYSISQGLPTEIYVPKKSQEVQSYRSNIDHEIIGVKKSKLNGWSWHGDAIHIKQYKYNSTRRTRTYYIGIKRKSTIIYVRDIILIRPPREGIERPYVAKVTSFWSDRLELTESDTQLKGGLIKDHSTMMMTVYWYYRPENVESLMMSICPSDKEVFLSRHYDDNSIACIIDRAFVLSYHSYCRFCALKRFYQEMSESYENFTPRRVVPRLATKDHSFPPENTDLSLVFYCKSEYNCSTGRISASQ